MYCRVSNKKFRGDIEFKVFGVVFNWVLKNQNQCNYGDQFENKVDIIRTQSRNR